VVQAASPSAARIGRERVIFIVMASRVEKAREGVGMGWSGYLAFSMSGSTQLRSKQASVGE
jgi:hypothetical protein